jgi:hypothetical protein
MPKNVLQDIVPPEKRSIRSIPLPRRVIKQTSVPPTSTQVEKEYEEIETSRVYPYNEERSPSFFRRYAVWIGSGIALIIVLFAVSSLFSSVTISVTPKSDKVMSSGDTILTAKQIPTAKDLEYQVITVSHDLGKSVPANGVESVERKASGKIIIFNTFDSNPQRLIKNTRFETPEGLVYRVNESVIVPGRTGQGAQMSPGSVEVTVYADEAGEKYNIGLKDFTIPGFKGDPRFKAIYGRSKTEMTNGFVGNVNKVSDADLASAKSELQGKLMEELKKDALSQTPEGYMMLEGGLFYSFESLPQSDQKSSSVTVNERGKLNGVIFSKKSLYQYLLSHFKNSLPQGDGDVLNMNDLNFTIQNREKFNILEDKEFSFTVKGDIVFVSKFDGELLKSDVVGKDKKDLDTILQSYSSIQNAKAVFRPFWKGTFPNDIKDIHIVTLSPTSE